MKKKLFLILLVQFSLFNLGAQEVEYNLSNAMTVGCSGASPVTDITKKATVNYSEGKAVMTVKSMACSKEFTFAQISSITGDKQVFYDESKSVALIKEGNDKMYLYKKSGSNFEPLSGGNTDKKAAKGTSAKSEQSNLQPLLGQIDGALAEMKKAAEEKKKKEEEEAKAKAKKADIEKRMAEKGEFYNKNLGKVFFTTTYRRTDDLASDNASSFVTEFELGASPLYCVTYFTPEMIQQHSLNIKYSIGDVSVSSEQLRALRGVDRGDRYSGGVASASYFANDFSGFFPMVSAEGKYYGPAYSMAEDAFRVLLSKVGPKLTVGSTHTVKVELSYSKDLKDVSGATFLSGEIKMKVTAKSEDLLSRLCMCKKKAKDDPTIEKQVKELFEADPTVQKVHRVYVIDRDYNIETSYGVPTKRTIRVSVLVTAYDGWTMVWTGSVAYKYDGSKYSDVAVFNKSEYYAPISPTCLKGKM